MKTSTNAGTETLPSDPETAASRENGDTKPRPAENEGRQPVIEVDDAHVVAGYANFCRVSSTPEELILDLGLNPQPMQPNTKVAVSQRIIMNHFTAKRLLAALSMALQRYESAFGVLETDVRRRVRGG
jgi:Protein of unknown function (DUF3467)